MKRASESQLGDLHEVLAMVIKEQITQTADFLNEDGELVESYTASPALLAVAAKFLKDNQITVSIEDDANLGEIENILAKKEKKGRLKLASVSTGG